MSRDLVVKATAYMKKRVDEVKDEFERHDHHATWEVWKNLDGWYGDMPGYPNLYEEDDWNRFNVPIEKTWEEFYGCLSKHDMLDDEARQLMEEFQYLYGV